MPDIDLIILIAALALGGFTFLRLLAAARMSAVCSALMERTPSPRGVNGGHGRSVPEIVAEVGG